MSEQGHILVVDDELGILDSVKRTLEREGLRVTTTDCGGSALDLLRGNDRVDVVLADIMMPKMNGVELLRAVKAISPSVDVVMMTAFGTVENAVECMRAGAYDFITKPLKRAMVLRAVQRALERGALIRENANLRKLAHEGPREQFAVGSSAVFDSLRDTLKTVSSSDVPVVLCGEHGCGRTHLAEAVHRWSGRTGEFRSFHVRSVPQDSIASLIFGTGGEDEGLLRTRGQDTVLISGIETLESEVQTRLVEWFRGLESKDTREASRLVVSISEDLKSLVQQEVLAESLYYTLSVVELKVPPLRTRRGDVIELIEYFLSAARQEHQRELAWFSDAALSAMDGYGWPGNIRELKNAVERLVLTHQGTLVQAEDLPNDILSEGLERSSDEEGFKIPFGMPLDEVERRIIRGTLERTGGDKQVAARLLGIAARTIYRKLDEL